MLSELHIRNLALIESLTLEFEEGFTVFTGETGAGKSILIGAIGLLLGDRASSESIRGGCDSAEINGVFSFKRLPSLLSELLDEYGVPCEDSELIIRRKISRSDRSKIHVNEIPLSLAALKKIGDLLIDLHGQHEHQSLLNEETHHIIIDSLDKVADARLKYDTTYKAFHEANRVLAVHTAETKTLNEKRDIIEFQLRELKQAQLKPGEEEELDTELKLLSSSAERIEASSGIVDILGGSTGNASIEKQIIAVQRKLEQLTKYDPEVSPWIDDVENALRIFTELETFCSSYLSTTGEQANPHRMEHINTRLARLQRLKKKYALSVAGLLDKEQQLRNDLSSLENSDADLKELAKQREKAKTVCVQNGGELSAARKKAAAKFDKNITALMEQLGFNGGEWKTVFDSSQEPTETGMETIRFFVRTNPGEALLPLAKTASGGEISRLMLAVKTILARHDVVSTLIFDEIDTGIGGIIAGAVGDTLKALSNSHQVLCISHLHQIASLANRQLKVYKEESGNRTVTRVVHLSNEERVGEIARMLGGDSGIALEHARELLGKR